jgi:tRNA pseudouridine55 synthase
LIGAVLVDKPAGKTSHDVVQQVRRALGTRAAGHTGTLDPFATGLLVVLLGRATRLARFIEAQPKTYLATGRLGVRTITDDLTGQVITTSPAPVPEASVREALAGFLGSSKQRPPQFSAKRIAGERSYRKARRGETVDLAPVPITVHEIRLLAYQSPDFDFRVTVSAGTYVRALARDLGEQLGVGAHLTALRRESIGSLQVAQAVTLEHLGPEAVVPAQQVLADLPTMEIDETARRDIVHGRAVLYGGAAGQLGRGAAVALLAGGDLVAVARAEDGWLQPSVVLANDER